MKPFEMCEGPRNASVALVGEAPAEIEWQNGRPFLGSSGSVLNEILYKAGLPRSSCFITNAFTDRPPNGDLEKWLVPKREAGQLWLTPVMKGKYLSPALHGHIHRLHEELATVRPKVIICLGGAALWAVYGLSGIKANRGVMLQSAEGWKVIGTFHPAAIVREYGNLPIAVMDFRKAMKYIDGSPLKFTPRRLLLNPTLEELYSATETFLADTRPLSIDIETKAGQITCVGFGRPDVAITFPFWDGHSATGYFGAREAEAWLLVQRLLLSPIPKVFQNGLYDIQYLWYVMGLRVENAEWDTMLMHHAMQPEMQKSLGFLASLHLDEPAWKDMRSDFSRVKDQLKKDD